MNQSNFLKNSTATGFLFLFLAVALGAFGAHGLQKILTPKALKTFHTGVTYQYYHSFALIFIGILSHQMNKFFKLSFYSYLIGMIIFSFNCYLYAITGIKFFAIIVPVGGVAFMIGHIATLIKIIKD
jgi:uncharacterized membrane protein YgdD (TMEM256/DUF423 family)